MSRHKATIVIQLAILAISILGVTLWSREAALEKQLDERERFGRMVGEVLGQLQMTESALLDKENNRMVGVIQMYHDPELIEKYKKALEQQDREEEALDSLTRGELQ